MDWSGAILKVDYHRSGCLSLSLSLSLAECANRKVGGAECQTLVFRLLSTHSASSKRGEHHGSEAISSPTPDVISSFTEKNFSSFLFSVRKKKKKKIFSGSTVGIDREAVIAAFDSPDCNCLLNVSVEEANNNFDKRECLPGNRYWASQHEIGAHTHLYITIDCHAHEPRVNNMFPARPIRSLNVGGRFISIDFALFA